MNPVRLCFAGAMAFAAALPSGLVAAAGGDDSEEEIRALRGQIRALDERLQDLERKQKLKDQIDAAAKAAPRVTVTDRGYSIASADGASALRFGGLVQLDSRLFFDDGGGVSNNTFVLRRARLIAEGTLGRIYSFQIVPEFGGSSVSLLDANATIAPTSAVQFKLGRFKVPVGLELLQSDTATFFVERSLVSNLVPNRDLGIQVGGTVAGGRVSYSVDVFNGVPDAGSTTNADFDNDKDAVARVFVEPFKTDKESPLRGLGVGVAASIGRQKGAASVTSGYKTEGQQTFFRYSGSTLADGPVRRVSPQAWFYRGPLGLLGEYAVSTVNVRPGAAGPKTALQHRAWQVAAGCMLTGEDAAFTNVSPRQPFSWTGGTWGGWQIVARYSQLRLDDRTFPTFAAPTTNARGASSAAFGVNWYLSGAVRTSLDYFQTHFDLPVASSATQILRQDERTLISRLQLSF